MKVILHSDEINLLIYRYLQESGFIHSAFTLGAEANLLQPVSLSSLDSGGDTATVGSLVDQLGPKLPPNCLVGLLQKALLYVWVEHHTDMETGREIPCSEPFGLFVRHECIDSPQDSSDTSCAADSGRSRPNIGSREKNRKKQTESVRRGHSNEESEKKKDEGMKGGEMKDESVKNDIVDDHKIDPDKRRERNMISDQNSPVPKRMRISSRDEEDEEKEGDVVEESQVPSVNHLSMNTTDAEED